MSYSHILSSDTDLELEFLRGLKERKIDQKFMYFGGNASDFYTKWPHPKTELNPSAEEMAEVLSTYVARSGKLLIISVGCGNSQRELAVLQLLRAQDIDVEYLAIDSSKEMLALTEQTFKGTEYVVQTVLADFMGHRFIQEINHITKHHEKRAFMLLGGTLGNLSQTAAIDSLYNILSPGEHVLIEPPIRPSLKHEDDLKIFKRYASALEMIDLNHVVFSALEKIGIPYDSGEMTIQTEREVSSGVLRIGYSFKIIKPIRLSYRGEVLHLLPPEHIQLYNVRLFFPDTFIEFVENHEFTHVHSLLKMKRGLFTFKKNTT